MSPTSGVDLSLFLSLLLFFLLGSVQARSVPNLEFSKSTGWNQTCVEGSCTPRNIHFAVTGHPSGLAVSWLTLGLSKTSTVKYGVHPRSYHSLATGVSHTYQGSDENDYVFFNHDVVLTDLLPNKRYFFVCGDEEGGFSEELSFTTPAQKREHDATIAMYGDMGISNSQTTIKALTALAKKGLYDLVFHVGDISYADDYPSGMYEEVWNAWFEQMSEVMKRVPYMVTPGNHEFSCGHAGCDYTTNFTAYLHRFRMPYLESNALNNMWYSFDYSNIHFIAISTETDFSDAPEGTHLFGDQMKWLREDLTKANNNRKNVPWIIVGGHRPIYSSSKGYTSSGVPFGDTLHLQTAVEDLFQEFHVDLFVVGHVHSYERCYPTYKSMKVSDSYVNPNATVYVIAGAAGNTEGFANPTPDSWDQPPPVWSAHRFGTDYGFALVRVFRKADSKQDVLNWRFFRSGDGGLEDEFNLIKDITSH